MAKLPGPEELGQVNPGSGERPIGSIDAQPIARGYEQLGTGLSNLGRGVEDLEASKARYDFALARGGFTSEMIAQNEAMSRDLNYGPDANGNALPQRYQLGAQQIRDKWAASIGSGPMRQRFIETVSPSIAEGQARADTHAYGLYRDHQVAAADQLGEQLGNQAVSTDDPNVHTQAMDAYGHTVDALAQGGLITQDQAVAKKRTFGSGLAQGLLLQQSANGDPLGALNHIRATPGSDDELVERELQIEGYGKPGTQLSHAFGYGQFEPGTWLPLIKQLHPELADRPDAELLALRADPNLGREMTKALLQQNRNALQAQGLQADAGNLYLAHFLGAGGAAKVLKANPNTPVAALLDPKAIAANQSVLGGRTAGSVIDWAHGRMGGYAPGEGSIYSMIPPERRAQLETHFLSLTQAKQTADLADFRQREVDSVAEAYNTGAPKQPLAADDFVRAYGPDKGPAAFRDYQGELQLGSDLQHVSGLSPAEQQQLYESYTPQPGSAGYAEAAKRQDLLEKAIDQANSQLGVGKHAGSKTADPAAYAVRNLPAVTDAWNALGQKLGDPSASNTDKQLAARDYVTRTMLEQQRLGVPPDQMRVVQKSYIDRLQGELSAAATSDDPQARVKLVGRVQQEAALWGAYWPEVMRELAPNSQPVVRAIAAGADPVAMTRLLALPADEAKRPAAILKQQNGTKASEVQSALNDAFAPFRSTLVGRQFDRDYPGYYQLGNELASLYVRDGLSATDASAKAFNDLVGARYDFRDSYRIPKSAGVQPDDVQAGAQDVRSRLASFPIKPTTNDMNLGAANAADSFFKFARGGKWVTAADNSGLNLVYDGNFVRSTSPTFSGPGGAFQVSWAQLANLGSHARSGPPPQDAETKRTNAARHGVEVQ